MPVQDKDSLQVISDLTGKDSITGVGFSTTRLTTYFVNGIEMPAKEVIEKVSTSIVACIPTMLLLEKLKMEAPQTQTTAHFDTAVEDRATLKAAARDILATNTKIQHEVVSRLLEALSSNVPTRKDGETHANYVERRFSRDIYSFFQSDNAKQNVVLWKIEKYESMAGQYEKESEQEAHDRQLEKAKYGATANDEEMNPPTQDVLKTNRTTRPTTAIPTGTHKQAVMKISTCTATWFLILSRRESLDISVVFAFISTLTERSIMQNATVKSSHA